MRMIKEEVDLSEYEDFVDALRGLGPFLSIDESRKVANMSCKINCPHCGHSGLVPEGSVGKRATCKRCKSPFVVQAPTGSERLPRSASKCDHNAITSMDAKTDRPFPETEQPQTADPTLERRVKSRNDASVLIAGVMKRLPRASSAYRPSGRTTMLAFVVLPLGAVVGAAAGLIVALLFVRTVVFGLSLTSLGTPSQEVGGIWGLVLFLTWIVAFTMMGIITGFIVYMFGKVGTNRNRLLTAVTSFASALLTVWMLSLIGPIGLIVIPLSAGDSGGLLVLPILNLIISTFIAFKVADNLLCDSKFCEPCKKYLLPRSLGSLSINNALTFVGQIGQHRVTEASQVLARAQR
jgi:hypothetical protein